MRILYDLAILLYGAAIRVASLFSPKANKWVKGRNGLFSKIGQEVGQLDSWTIGQKTCPAVQLSNRPTVQLSNRPTVQLSNRPAVSLVPRYYLHSHS